MRELRSVASVGLIGLLLAGCSSGSNGSGLDTGVSAKYQKAMKFSQCMRVNGVGEFPDPSSSGSLTLAGVVNVNFLDPSAPAWKNAIRVCKDLQPAGFTGGTGSAS